MSSKINKSLHVQGKKLEIMWQVMHKKWWENKRLLEKTDGGVNKIKQYSSTFLHTGHGAKVESGPALKLCVQKEREESNKIVEQIFGTRA